MQPRSNMRWYLSGLVALPIAIILVLFFLNPSLIHLEGLRKPAEPPKPTPHIAFDKDKWAFEMDVDSYPLPQYDLDTFSKFPPHNYRGAGNKAFATFYTSRNATDRDPYFVAAQQIVYRLLWDPKRKSSHPVIIFVTEMISDRHRKYFEAAGAIVREVKLNKFEPVIPGIPERLKDMFSKLQMWRQTDFSRIAYLDSDAFPMQNIDGIFDLAPEQQCKEHQLPLEDQFWVASLCKYVFAGYMELGDQINAGVMVLKPDEAMHMRLLRESRNKTGWDTGFMEQALLNKAFHPTSPFPYSSFGHEWNSGKDQKGILDIHILHHKAWADFWEPDSWVTKDYNDTWFDMLALYQSPQFVKMRKLDLRASLTSLGNLKGIT